MPGEMTAKLLKPESSVTFHKLAHFYHHHLSSVEGIGLSSEVASRVIDKLPDSIVESSAEFEQFKSDIHRFAAQGMDISASIREIFRQVYSQPEHWQPYDGPTWDKFFARLNEQLRPKLDAFKQAVDSLKIPDDLLNHVTKDADLKHYISIISTLKIDLLRTIKDLEERLEPAYFETWCGELYSSGSFI